MKCFPKQKPKSNKIGVKVIESKIYEFMTSNLVKSNVQVRGYGDEKWKGGVPLGLKNTFLMGSYGLRRLVSVVSDIKYMNHRVC